jgi:D-alanyl-D-alanine dipeptidase
VGRALALAILVAMVAAPSAQAGFRSQLERRGLVDLTEYVESADLDLRYATKNNFTKEVLPGYCEEHAYLRRRAARALGRVQQQLRGDGLGLRVYDAYRPARATRAMVRWAERTGRPELLNGYIARRSNHNRGVAVDLTLVRVATGRELDMGNAFDSFSPRSSTTAVGGKPLRNRLRLRGAMEGAGFANYRREWWHYDYAADTRARSFDIALGC